MIVQECAETHLKCQRHTPILPDRVLDIDQGTNQGRENETSVRLVEGNQRREKYMALSYCWGKTQNLTTTTETIATWNILG
jgi:hypothetical protein